MTVSPADGFSGIGTLLPQSQFIDSTARRYPQRGMVETRMVWGDSVWASIQREAPNPVFPSWLRTAQFSAILFAMGDDPIDVDEAREKVRRARAAYDEVMRSQDTAGMKRLKAELYNAEAELVRVKRAHETAPPGHLLRLVARSKAAENPVSSSCHPRSEAHS